VCGEVTNDSKLMCEEIKSRGSAKNACHHSVQSLLPTCLLSADIETEFCRTLIVSCVLYRVFVGKPEGRRPLGRPRRR
jgi:hypothetical protein